MPLGMYVSLIVSLQTFGGAIQITEEKENTLIIEVDENFIYNTYICKMYYYVYC